MTATANPALMGLVWAACAVACSSVLWAGDRPADTPQASRPGDATISAPDWLEPGQRLTGRLIVTNQQGTPASWKVSYSVQADGSMFHLAPPDPVYGTDHALGTRSWTEADGKTIEEGSLTDGKDYTDAGTPWIDKHWGEAFQYVDLGRARTITRISYGPVDANHAGLLDVAVSRDGKSYTPIPELQDFDMYHKWGSVVLPLKQPVEAQYIRLRYHKDNPKLPCFRMPCSLSVYDGVADEVWDLPKVGEVLGEGQKTVDVAPRDSGAVELGVEQALSPGLYLVAARVECGAWRQILYRHVLVLPEPMKAVSAESRFGINGARDSWAPILRRLSVGWVRFENLKWPFYSPDPGVYRFDGSVNPWQVNLDTILKGYRDAELNVLPFLFMTAGYASSAPADVKEGRRWFYPPKQPQQFAEFAFQVAARYGATTHAAAELKTADGKSGLGYLRVYEIWNEPNLTDPGWGAWVGTIQQHFELFRPAAEAIKRADPAAKVTSAGYSGIQVKTADKLRSYTYADGKRPLDFVDILNVHFYSGRIAPELAKEDFNANWSGETTAEEDLQRLAAWRDAHKPGMPIWLTETGYDSGGPFGTDERTQAARLPRVVMLALANGMDKVFVYRESGSTPSMHACSGVLRDDGSFKPSWLTYATLIRELDGVEAGALRLPYPDKNVRFYGWQLGKETFLTAWTIEGEGRLELNLGRAMVTDAFGHRRETDLAQGLGLSIFPVYIRGVSGSPALQAVLAQARQEQALRRQRREQLAKAEAYLFNFGGGAEAVTLDVGRERPFTPVLAGDVYTEEKSYGFSPGPGAENQERKWVANDLDRTLCRVHKGQEFQFRVKPGRYQLRLGVSPDGDAHVAFKGAAGGDRALPAAKGDSIVEAAFEAAGLVLSISIDNYGSFRWLTLIAQLPGE